MALRPDRSTSRSVQPAGQAAPQGDAFLRELVIGFGASGYVVLFEIEDAATVTVLAVRHQREDDYR